MPGKSISKLSSSHKEDFPNLSTLEEQMDLLHQKSLDHDEMILQHVDVPFAIDEIGCALNRLKQERQLDLMACNPSISNMAGGT